MTCVDVVGGHGARASLRSRRRSASAFAHPTELDPPPASLQICCEHHEGVSAEISRTVPHSLRSAATRLLPGRRHLHWETTMANAKDHNDDTLTVDRRGALECMLWAGTGVLWTITGG